MWASQEGCLEDVVFLLSSGVEVNSRSQVRENDLIKSLHFIAATALTYIHRCTAISLMPRPHPAHVRRRDLVSQIQILGLAPEALSDLSNLGVALIGIMWQQEQVLQWYCSR